MDRFESLKEERDWLYIQVEVANGLVPVRISREAMEVHFGAGKGPGALRVAFLESKREVQKCALQKMVYNAMYTPNKPLVLMASDFEVSDSA